MRGHEPAAGLGGSCVVLALVLRRSACRRSP